MGLGRYWAGKDADAPEHEKVIEVPSLTLADPSIRTSASVGGTI